MSLKKCFETGQLKRTTPDLSLAQKSLKRGTDILNEINNLLEADFMEVAEQRLYQAYFHLFKVLLYKDGIKERSHYCTILYVKEKYKTKLKKFISIIKVLKDLRDQSQYGVEPPSIEPEEIEDWIINGKVLSKTLTEVLSSSD